MSAQRAESAARDRTVRLALFLPTLGGGGAERVMHDLARGFAGRGYAVDLLVACAGRSAVAGGTAENPRLLGLGARRTLAALAPLVRYLRSWRPRALLSTLNHANVVAAAAVVLARVPVRLVLREPATFADFARTRTHWRDRLLPAIMPVAYRRADAVIAVSRGVADSLARRRVVPQRRLAVIANPVDATQIRARACAEAGHPWLGDDGIPVVMAAGRLGAEKDFATLLHAFALLKARRPARLVILGDGPQRGELERLAGTLGVAAQVAMPGFQDNPWSWIARSRVFVLSSLTEGFPNVLVEALACGVPVVATDCPSGPREILDDGRCGSLVPVGDATAMAAAIEEMLARPTPAALLRAALGRYEPAVIVDRYLDVLLG